MKLLKYIIFLPFFIISCDNSTEAKIVYGCTNSVATNYEPAATFNDGSCLYSNCGMDICLQLEYNEQNEIIIQATNVEEISGFQFKLNNVMIDSFTGGHAIDEGFSITNSNITYMIIGFSMMAGYIPIGEGTLLKINFSEIQSSTVCISEPLFVGTGNPIPTLSINTGDCLNF